MGNTWQRIVKTFHQQEIKMLMVGELCTVAELIYWLMYYILGLDAAGKTTTLYKLKLGEIVTTIPTIGKHHVIGRQPKLVFLVL